MEGARGEKVAQETSALLGYGAPRQLPDSIWMSASGKKDLSVCLSLVLFLSVAARYHCESYGCLPSGSLAHSVSVSVRESAKVIDCLT